MCKSIKLSLRLGIDELSESCCAVMSGCRDARAAITAHAQGTLSVYMQAAAWLKDPVYVDAFRRWCLVWQHAIKVRYGSIGEVW